MPNYSVSTNEMARLHKDIHLSKGEQGKRILKYPEGTATILAPLKK